MKKIGWEVVFPKDNVIKGVLVSRYSRTRAPHWLRSDQNGVAETRRKTIFANDVKDYIFVEIKINKILHKNKLKIHVF